ncbi:MAG: sigma-70 family RNA polymerase sigma factor [Planctomycetota bacterium]
MTDPHHAAGGHASPGDAYRPNLPEPANADAQAAPAEAAPADAVPVDSEENLIRLSLGGDQTALEQLLLRYYDRLQTYIGRRVSPEDILQHAYLKALRSIATFEPRGGYAFFGWLKRIADNELTDQIRKARREPRPTTQQSADDSCFDPTSQLAGKDETATVLARRRELKSTLRRTLSRLKPEYQTAIELRYLKELALDEVAEQMGISEGQLRGLPHRGRKAVKDEIRRLSHLE